MASSKRAGSWARGRARRLQLDFLKRNRRALLLVVGLAILATPALLLFSEGQRWFLLGTLTAGVPAMLYHVVVLASGSAPYVVGDLGEQWTHAELKPLRRSGWRIVHHLVFQAGRDIDTVLVGPSGVVVVETKWSSDPWGLPKQTVRIQQAVRQVRDNAKTVAIQVKQANVPTTTSPVVVLWPSDPSMTRTEIDGVAVLPGNEFRSWLAELPREGLDTDGAHRAWLVLRDRVATRDEWERQHLERAPRSPERLLADLAQVPLGVLVGVTGSSTVLQLVNWPLAAAPLAGLAAVAGWCRRFGPARRFATAVCWTLSVLVGAVALLDLLSRTGL